MVSAIAIYHQPELLAGWEQRETQDRARKIKIVTGAVLQAPVRVRKQVQGFAHVREHDQYEGTRSHKLHAHGQSSSSNERDPRAKEQQASWEQRK